MTNAAAGLDWESSGCIFYWEYEVPEDAKRFEAHCGPSGRRAGLYQVADGLIRTDLQRDANDTTVYRTADYWVSREAFLAFLRDHSAEYDALSREGEGLSARQTNPGVFLLAGKAG